MKFGAARAYSGPAVKRQTAVVSTMKYARIKTGNPAGGAVSLIRARVPDGLDSITVPLA